MSRKELSVSQLVWLLLVLQHKHKYLGVMKFLYLAHYRWLQHEEDRLHADCHKDFLQALAVLVDEHVLTCDHFATRF